MDLASDDGADAEGDTEQDDSGSWLWRFYGSGHDCLLQRKCCVKIALSGFYCYVQ